MQNKNGCDIEEAMKRWFHGESHYSGCVDFQTEKSLYEVKSCNLFNPCTNGNDKRKFTRHRHKQITTTQLGRFQIDGYNHGMLKEISISENKIPKYIFVIRIGKQNVWRTRPWEFVDRLLKEKRDKMKIRIKNIFGVIT